jgi:hypothetical protein
VPEEPLAWPAGARAVYFTGRSRGVEAIWKLEVDPDTRTVVGGPHRMTTTTEDAAGVTIARATGDIAFSVASRTPRVSWFPLDSTGRHTTGPAETVASSTTESNYPTVTTDGRRLVFNVLRKGGVGGWDLRLRDVSEPAEWSVDGRVLDYVSDRGGLLNVWGVAFDPDSGRVGAAFQVTAIDGLERDQFPDDLAGFELGLTRNRLVIPTLRPTSGIWLLHRER